MSLVVSAPSLALLGLEPFRAVFDYARSQLASFDAAPEGDGHPVVVFPGLATNELATSPLREFCRARGYAAYDWGAGLNTGPRGDFDEWLAPLARRVESLANAHRTKVSLIGWSLGGLYARELAKKLPERVRQVITLGTPHRVDENPTNVGWLYELLSGQPAAVPARLARRLGTAPPVPVTAVYSRTDGVVAWQSCAVPDTRRCQGIEVNDASHLGLVAHPKVFAIVADRLGQPTHAWRPYSDDA